MDLEEGKKYYVVELTDPPSHMVVDKYVCVPKSWLVFGEKPSYAVKFPIEKLSVTKQRVKRREKHSNSWMIFVANVKYGTDSYKDAKSYIKSLNAKLNQSQSSATNDSETKQGQMICDIEPPSNESDSELTSLPDSDGEDFRKPTNVGEALKTTDKRYFTRQSRKRPSTDLSQAISSMSLDPTSEENPVKSHDCTKEGTNAKYIKDNESIENNQESSNASVRRQQLIDNANMIDTLSSIAGSALQDQDVLKRLEEISMYIKQSIDNGTDPSKIKQPVFGEDFMGFMQDLYAHYDRCQDMLYNTRNKYIKNCLTTKKIIGIVNKLNKSHADSNFVEATEVTNAVAEDEINNDIVVINEDKTSKTNQPKKKQTEGQKKVNTVVVNETIDDVTDNARTDGQKAGNVREAAKFTLPPDYNSKDSTWTRRHRELSDGLKELIPNTGVYINTIRLENCKRLSRETRTLARLLMVEIFSDSALVTCSVTGKKATAYSGNDVRPGLDEHARTVLLQFVEQHARENNWAPSSRQLDLHSMRNKLREYRYKFAREKNINS